MLNARHTTAYRIKIFSPDKHKKKKYDETGTVHSIAYRAFRKQTNFDSNFKMPSAKVRENSRCRECEIETDIEAKF